MKETTFNSLKLPRKWDEFSSKMSGNDGFLWRLTFTVYGYISEPKSIIEVNGHIADNIVHGYPKMTKNNVRYQGRFTVKEPNIKLIEKELKNTFKKHNILNYSIELNNATFVIDEQKYLFTHNSKARGLTLNRINGKLINNKKKSEVEKLMNNNFSFCDASTCRKTYKEVWECE